ncbi:Uncharacterised protein [Raoultella terrigena]|uniref:Uncharacterized protein n=1 Tax=Raoultella terrigena TaxID=577 RepID=A0A4U9CVD0_RAOTE|nr:Uncharacterised protein [Raoultella terrigena]
MRARKGITCEENNLFTIMFHPWAHHLSTKWQVKEAIVISTSSFGMPLCWLRSFTPVTYYLYAPGIHSLAALTHAE